MPLAVGTRSSPEESSQRAAGAGTRVLVLCDRDDILSPVLSSLGLTPLTVASVVRALELLGARGPGGLEALYLDVAQDPWPLLERLRSEHPGLPMLLCLREPRRPLEIRALRLGADDCLSPPFDAEEVAARLASILRRYRSLPVLQVGAFRIDVVGRTVDAGAKTLELSPREFDLMLALAESPGRPVERGVLLRRIWGLGPAPEGSPLEVLVSRLRRKLGVVARDPVPRVGGSAYSLSGPASD